MGWQVIRRRIAELAPSGPTLDAAAPGHQRRRGPADPFRARAERVPARQTRSWLRLSTDTLIDTVIGRSLGIGRPDE